MYSQSHSVILYTGEYEFHASYADTCYTVGLPGLTICKMLEMLRGAQANAHICDHQIVVQYRTAGIFHE